MTQEVTVSGMAKGGSLVAIWSGITSLAFEAFGRHPTSAAVLIGGVLAVLVQFGSLFIYASCDEKTYVTLYVATLLGLFSAMCAANEIRWMFMGLPEWLRSDAHGSVAAVLAVPPLLFGGALVLAVWGIRTEARWRQNWTRSRKTVLARFPQARVEAVDDGVYAVLDAPGLRASGRSREQAWVAAAGCLNDPARTDLAAEVCAG
ncbi:hypothetical protein [Paraburkholderia youngii]|uniref:hypothetical protein n=1 Tax=Paraburkholderia youngii TaxID=2782701 RepID=UPI003D1A0D47